VLRKAKAECSGDCQKIDTALETVEYRKAQKGAEAHRIMLRVEEQKRSFLNSLKILEEQRIYQEQVQQQVPR